ncbi:hypothetical protein OUZ56_006459 [Daphnia magna]|uniref:Uncharacterized protein n=1 Tax=Daphnia magna TaxID=35525 RepID=A0ABQ9YVR6_9CRUS|nr:hypothetical protein OUZ56_006459 [Daphnia magna]
MFTKVKPPRKECFRLSRWPDALYYSEFQHHELACHRETKYLPKSMHTFQKELPFLILVSFSWKNKADQFGTVRIKRIIREPSWFPLRVFPLFTASLERQLPTLIRITSHGGWKLMQEVKKWKEWNGCRSVVYMYGTQTQVV